MALYYFQSTILRSTLYQVFLSLIMCPVNTWLRCCLLSFSTMKNMFYLLNNKQLASICGEMLEIMSVSFFTSNFHPLILVSINNVFLKLLFSLLLNNYFLMPNFLLYCQLTLSKTFPIFCFYLIIICTYHYELKDINFIHWVIIFYRHFYFDILSHI